MLKFKETVKNNMVIMTARKNKFKYQIKSKEEIFCVIWDLKKDAAYNTKWSNIKFNSIEDAKMWINSVDISTLTYKD